MQHATARYRHWYANLLHFYPKPYRERFGESMEQTFNDLLRERKEAGGGLFGFVLWVFVETSTGIIRENSTFMTPIMTSMLIKHGAIIISVITAIAILASAYLAKGSEYENAWLIILAVGSVLASVFELYSKTKDEDKR
jgi:hypothetical protein